MRTAGYALAFPTPEALKDPHKALESVLVFKPGEGMGSAEKQLTALLLDPKDNSLLCFGMDARKKFASMCDDSKGTQ
jgi:hypothetical protein